jgi:hypothetical protein
VDGDLVVALCLGVILRLEPFRERIDLRPGKDEFAISWLPICELPRHGFIIGVPPLSYQ